MSSDDEECRELGGIAVIGFLEDVFLVDISDPSKPVESCIRCDAAKSEERLSSTRAGFFADDWLGGSNLGFGLILLGSGDTTSVATRRTICGGVAGRSLTSTSLLGFGFGFGFAAGLGSTRATTSIGLGPSASSGLGLRLRGGVGKRNPGRPLGLGSDGTSLFLTGSVSPIAFSNMEISDVVGGIGLVSGRSFPGAESPLLLCILDCLMILPCDWPEAGTAPGK